ncbi:MAG TPA: hypothetical protein VFR19_22235 [Hyphomicrobiaceae bacterium]|jgi:hypothetical protein|nr:hypothetical protein [Hyphomicrobiaceae bacterium]
MMTFRGVLVAGCAAAGLLLAAGAAQAQCVNKAGQGTNTTEQGAKSQAYEAVLQATDWGMWAVWMGQGQKYGSAPGYKVSNLKSRCTKGGLGSECVVQAKLCKL